MNILSGNIPSELAAAQNYSEFKAELNAKMSRARTLDSKVASAKTVIVSSTRSTSVGHELLMFADKLYTALEKL